ncbi:macro domain-containing protein [Cytobacillus sp. FSL H8-0458]|uniref:macro domain-containing protein n=1 Tax=Cytobacillus sp. FSL H8-0458 TaxID=2975346 RepID=UPI0030FBABA6
MKNNITKLKALVFDKTFWQNTWIVPSVLFAITTTFLSFIEIEWKDKLLYGLIIVSLLYILISLNRVYKLHSISLNIDGSEFEVTSGDIFQQDSECYKVIAFNEFFDTLVDDNLISESSLNGQYILKKYPSNNDINELNRRISNDPRLDKKELDVYRKLGGNTTRYELGSIFKDKDYFLVAFSKFNEKNEANLKLTEYAACLLKFWGEVNTLYNRKTVVLPLLGSGITRHKDFNASNQQLLEILIWTFKISKVKFREPSKVKILIHERQLGEINFYKLKEMEKIGI